MLPVIPFRPHHSLAATRTASASRKSPIPSRRCSGSSSLALRPIRRTVPPATGAIPIQVARTALTGRAAGLTLALLRRGAGLRGTGLRGADWPLRPLAAVDGFPRPPDLGRGPGVVVRVATVVAVRERHAGITRHTPAERPNLGTMLAVLCQVRDGEATDGPRPPRGRCSADVLLRTSTTLSPPAVFPRDASPPGRLSGRNHRLTTTVGPRHRH